MVINAILFSGHSHYTLEEYKKTLPAYITVGDFKVNKTVIKDMIKKDGVIVPGAALEENWSVVMK